MTQKILNEGDIQQILKEEFVSRVSSFSLKESDDKDKKVGAFSPAADDIVIRPPLQIRHKKTGVNYTVVSSSVDKVVIRRNNELDSEGQDIVLTPKEFEKDYGIE